MTPGITQWIEEVRMKPEHIRRRYVVLCVAISMVLVVGVWFLTVTESFQAVSSDAGDAASGARNILPKSDNFSLDNLLKNNQSLGTEQKQTSGEDYFQNQPQVTNPHSFDEGVAPVPDKGSTTTNGN